VALGHKSLETPALVIARQRSLSFFSTLAAGHVEDEVKQSITYVGAEDDAAKNREAAKKTDRSAAAGSGANRGNFFATLDWQENDDPSARQSQAAPTAGNLAFRLLSYPVKRLHSSLLVAKRANCALNQWCATMQHCRAKCT